MNELALFAGAGGGILASKLLGWRTVCAVEVDAYCAAVLAQRQNDGLVDPFPIWSDVRSFDGAPWEGCVDVVSGGFPCQDISAAGKGAGIDGERSALWVEMARIIGEVRPRYAFVENSPMLTSRGLGMVLGDLAEMGFDARWGVVGAADLGAPHIRDRIWIMAYADRNNGRPRRQGRLAAGSEGERQSDQQMANAEGKGLQITRREKRAGKAYSGFTKPSWWSIEPDLGRVANGIPARVDRLKAIGNGQVPAVAAEAWKLLINGEMNE